MSTVRTVYTNFKAARSAIKDLNRLRQISAVLIRHGFGYLLKSNKNVDDAVSEVLREANDTIEPAANPQSTRFENKALGDFSRANEILQDLGPTFVKFGQILSTRTDLLPAELCTQLSTLQDQVKPITYEEVSQVIQEEFGAQIEDLFTYFSESPLACASIAQVHTAKINFSLSQTDSDQAQEEALSNDAEQKQIEHELDVVVKVQRPGIQATIEADLSILHFLAKQAVDAIPEVEAFRPDKILVEFERAILKELDFNYESNNLIRFERNFREWDTVHIPKLYRQLSTQRVITMERLRGVKITEAPQYGHPMDQIAQETVRMLFKQCFEDGFFHGDLHPGNLLILEDSRIGLIDFGLVGRLSPAMRETMADLLLHVTTKNNEGVARSLYEISIHQGQINYNEWEADVAELMEQHFTSSSLADVDFGQIVRDLIEGAVRHKAQIPPDYTMFFKSIITVEGIGKLVSPDLDIITEIRPYAQKLIAQRYQPEQLMRSAIDGMHSLSKFSKRLPHTAQQLMQQVEDKQLGFQLSDAHLEERFAHQRALVNLLISSFMSVCLLALGLAFMMHPELASWSYSFGVILCMIGSSVGTLILYKTVWQGQWSL